MATVSLWLVGALFVASLLVGKWQANQQKMKWRQVAQAMGGSYVETTWTSQVIIPLHAGTVTLDTFTSTSRATSPASTTYTRLRIPLVVQQEFEFVLMNRNAANQLLMQTMQSRTGELATSRNTKAEESLRLLMLGEVLLGNDDFDTSFILKSAQEMQVRKLFAMVKDQLIRRNEFDLFLHPHRDVSASAGATTKILHYQEKGVVSDVTHLREVCKLLQSIAQELQHSGIASDQKAQVTSPLAL
jgi:hypothetical protein